jgi:hypothetical protein
VWDDSYVVFGHKFPGEEESARLCIAVMQKPVLLSPKMGGGIFKHFHADAVKYHRSIWN